MEPWLLIILGIILIFITIAKTNGRRLISLLLRIIGIILIGYGVNEYIQGAI